MSKLIPSAQLEHEACERYNNRMDEIDRVMTMLRGKWKQYPRLRLCQLMENVITMGNPSQLGPTHDNHCIFHVNDEKLEEALKRYNP